MWVWDKVVEMSEEQIGKYKILSELGKGSMGVVYLAEDPEIGRQVAIKTLRSIYLGEDTQGQEALQRFRQESRSAGRLKHPNIITIFEAGRNHDGTPFIVMEFVDGESLEEVLTRDKKFEPLEALHMLAQIASAIDYAHTFEIIHRDIKPSNVILDKARKPYLLDFGVAKLNDNSLTPAGTVVGTPSYMAPEQIRGESLTGATDRFAFAVLAFEMLTGLRPFPGGDFMSVASNIIHSEPITFVDNNIDLDKKFEPILRKGLSKALADRYPSCLEFVREIGRQFDIPIDQSGVSGFRLGLTMRELLASRPGSTASKSASKDDVSATVMSRPAVGATGNNPTPTSLPKQENPIAPSSNNGPIREGGGKGAAIFVGAFVLLIVAAGVFYLLAGGTSEKTDQVDLSSSSEANTIQITANVSEPAVIKTACGLGDSQCTDPSVSLASSGVMQSALSAEAEKSVTEAVVLASESVSPGVSTDENLLILSDLSNPETTADKLIEIIPTASKLTYEESISVLLKLVTHPDYKVRIAALKLFTSSDKYRTREVFRTIVERLDDKEFLVRGFSAKFLASLKNEAARRILADRLTKETDPAVKKVIENALKD